MSRVLTPPAKWTLCAVAAFLASSPQAQAPDAPATGRAIPMSAAILRAHAAGTRDSTGQPGRNYWQVDIDYSIDARLDTGTSIVTGHATVVVHNTSPSSLDHIQLRLDQNRFRRSAAPGQRSMHVTDGMTVTRLVVDGDTATMGVAAGTRRPALSGTRSTSERITLARSVGPRDSLVLEVDWHFEVPLDESSSALRLGRWENEVYQVAQWYPRVAMFDDLNGWDTASYTGDLEFYNPYGTFDVRLDVPAGWLVGATGVLQNPEEVLASRTVQRLTQVRQVDSTVIIVGRDEHGAGKSTRSGERLVWQFAADSVSDFAWGASSRYVWQATRVPIPGREPVVAHMLYTEAHAANFEYAAARLRHDLTFNSTRIMPYAYPQHTLLDGPEGGMEYPMLTMSHGDGLAHELWHQWFPVMVGSNETWYAFMDEGFATYLAGETAAARSGRTRAERGLARRRTAVPLIWPDDRGPPDWRTAVYGYGLPSDMFRALAEIVGHEAVLEALAEYATAWRFKHPSPWDFMFMMNRSLGRRLDHFWHEWLFTAH